MSDTNFSNINQFKQYQINNSNVNLQTENADLQEENAINFGDEDIDKNSDNNFTDADFETEVFEEEETKCFKKIGNAISDFFSDLKSSIEDFFDNIFHKDDSPDTNIDNESGSIINRRIEETDDYDNYNNGYTIDSNYNFNNSQINTNEVNGLLDKEIQQGELGDCAFISTCNALYNTQYGANIIKNSITENADNNGNIQSYTVNFKGIKESYTIQKSELDSENASFSSGDKDMRLLELAFDKCCQNTDNPVITSLSNYSKNPGETLDGISPSAVLYLFTGEDFDYKFSDVSNKVDFLSGLNDKAGVGKIIRLSNDISLPDSNGNNITLDSSKKYEITEFNKVHYNIENKLSSESITHNDGKISIKNPDTQQVYTFNAWDLFYKMSTEAIDKTFVQNRLTEILSKIDNNSCAVFATFDDNNKSISLPSNGSYVNVYTAHEYEISGVTDNTLTLTNPHDTSEQIEIDKAGLYNIADKIHIFTTNFS